MDREAFKQRMQLLKIYRGENPGKGYLDWKKSLPTNLLDDRNYNLKRAYELDYKPEMNEDGYYHLPTRDQETGEILKKPWHPTFLIGLLEDAKIGYYPLTKNGVTYTTTWEGNEKPIYKYKDGGEIDKSTSITLDTTSWVSKPDIPEIKKYKEKSIYTILSTANLNNVEPKYTFPSDTNEAFYNEFLKGKDKTVWHNWHSNRTRLAELYKIPYIKDKEIRLSKGNFNTGRISTNLLDSIYDASLRTGVPFKTAIGLAGRESTLGIGREFNKKGYVTGTDLYSNWNQLETVRNSNKDAIKLKVIVEKYNTLLPLTLEELEHARKYVANAEKLNASLRPLKENPIDNALKYYNTGNYNRGDKRHSKMVELDGNTLMSDPAILKWYNNRIGSYAEGGEVPPARPNIPDQPIKYKGKLIKDKHGKSYTEDQYYDYLANSTDEISKFDSRPMVRGVKGIVDLQDAADLTPIGDIISAKDTYDAIKNEDWAGAGLAALTMLPFVPLTVKLFRKNYKGITPKSRVGVSNLNYNTSVNKNYTENLINQMDALNERDTKKLVKAINQSYNLAERLMDDPEYLLRAEQVNKLFGDDYSKAYADIIDAYNTDPSKLPGVAVKKNMKNNARGSMELFNDGTYDYNIDPQLTDLDEYLTEHEYGHYADWKLSGFVPDPSTGNKMFKEMQKDFKPDISNNSYFGKPTELKSHMNQLREYMFQKGYINKRGLKVEEKMLKNVLDDIKNIEGLKEVHTASTAFKNMNKYTKWFNAVPLLGMGVLGINKLTNNKNE